MKVGTTGARKRAIFSFLRKPPGSSKSARVRPVVSILASAVLSRARAAVASCSTEGFRRAASVHQARASNRRPISSAFWASSTAWFDKSGWLIRKR